MCEGSDVQGSDMRGSDVRGCCQRELHRRELASEPGTLLVTSRPLSAQLSYV